MKNRNMPAKPIWTDDMNLGDTAGSGLTKLEYAAIQAMSSFIPVYWGMSEEYDSPEELNQCLVESATETANKLFDELDKWGNE